MKFLHSPEKKSTDGAPSAIIDSIWEKKEKERKKVEEEEWENVWVLACVLRKSALLAEKAIESLLECGQNFKI